MTRFSTTVLLLLSAIAILVSADDAVAPLAPASGCVIATPQQDLVVGKKEKITFTGCQGPFDIKVRHGDPKNLSEMKTAACKVAEASATSCIFTPTKEGKYSFSAIDKSNVETFTGEFNVKGNPAGSTKAQDKKKSSPKAAPAPAKAQAAQMAQRRALYDLSALNL